VKNFIARDDPKKKKTLIFDHYTLIEEMALI
jgi:hypothetical protein